jgi:hypothetical protein
MNIKLRAALDVACFLVACAIMVLVAYLAPWVIGVGFLAVLGYALYIAWSIRVDDLARHAELVRRIELDELKQHDDD